jgi:hypothetical protein
MALYEFVRGNIRYISANIGRGDFKPASPEDVFNRKYGDCKDQTSLLIGLYRAVGITAYPGLIVTNDRPEIIDTLPWPGFFNHVITVLSSGKNPLYLDPSQPSCCFGRLPLSCRNRQILVCREGEKASLMVPALSDEGNGAEINLIYKMNRIGDIYSQMRIELTRDLAFVFYGESGEKVLLDIRKEFLADLPGDQLQKNFRLEVLSPDKIVITGDFITGMQPMPKSRGFLFKPISPCMQYLKKRFHGDNRVTPYECLFPIRLKETVNLKLPDDYRIDDDSLSLNFSEPSLQYHYQAFSGDLALRVYRYFQLGDYLLSPEKYNHFSVFLLKTIQAETQTIEIIPAQEHEKKKSP